MWHVFFVDTGAKEEQINKRNWGHIYAIPDKNSIADESRLTLPQREEFQIDITFAVDEFNFF